MSGETRIGAAQAAAVLRRQAANLAHLGNIRLPLVVELGRVQMRLSEAMRLKEQDVIELDKLAGESFPVLVHGHPFAEGELVAVTDAMAVRLTRLPEVQPSALVPLPAEGLVAG